MLLSGFDIPSLLRSLWGIPADCAIFPDVLLGLLCEAISIAISLFVRGGVDCS